MIKHVVLSFVFLTLSFSSFGLDISNYRYYQINKDLPNGKGPFYVVYIKKDDPCIFVDKIKDKTTHRFCRMGDSELDLEKNHPSIYPILMQLFGSRFSFVVAAPWNEQQCEIYLPRMELTCEPTGK
ncbi:hypothetical protein [Marinomonas primoryensis]|jgi:hypothetical protein|uniref:Uncharacterized protein n=1 Tax=Marinomonas primoryensis TaxID=178399 RepID=A0ABV0L2S0_9GAMM